MERQLRGLQVIYAAMIAGVASFSVVVALLSAGRLVAGAPTEVMVAVVTVTLVTCLASIGLVRSRLAASAAAQIRDLTDEQSISSVILSSYSTAAIVTAALLEGPALLSTTSVLVTGRIEFLAGAATGVFGLIMMFPKASGLDAWARRVTRDR